jgi:hypothetical protein
VLGLSSEIKLWSDYTWDSAVGIVAGYGLDTEGSEFECQEGQEFSLLHVVLTGSAAHRISYPKGTGGPFPGGKAAVA